MYPEVDDDILQSQFKRNKIYFALRGLKIKRATIVIEDETFEFIDKTEGDTQEYQLFRAGRPTLNFRVDHIKDRCPVCNTLVVAEGYDDDIPDFVIEDYKCRNCGFEGSQWKQETFVGHVSSVLGHTVESYRKLKS